MIVGLASYRFINNDLHFNLTQIERGLEAARGKASLLVFGEAFLQGFHAMNWRYEQDRNVAITQESGIMQSLRKMTVDYGGIYWWDTWKKRENGCFPPAS